MERPLSVSEARVLGALIEKEITTPEYYPLTLNALTAACNQKSNRDPVIQIAEAEVLRTLDALRDLKLAWQVSSNLGRALKYRHNAGDTLALSGPQQALLCELLLRGPQTAGELRIHTARFNTFTDAQQLQSALDALMTRPDDPLAIKLPPAPGKREPRYAHLLGGPPPADAAQAPPTNAALVVVLAENERIASLEQDLAALRNEVATLKAQLETLTSQLL